MSNNLTFVYKASAVILQMTIYINDMHICESMTICIRITCYIRRKSQTNNSSLGTALAAPCHHAHVFSEGEKLELITKTSIRTSKKAEYARLSPET